MKYKKVIMCAMFVGCLFAVLFYQSINKEVKAISKKDEIVDLFQVGVFKSRDNADTFSNTFASSLVYEDNGYYRVIIAISHDKEVKNVLEDYFKSQEINYYLKSIRVNKIFIEKLENYEKIILKSKKEDIINNINNSVLKLFASYI